MSKTQVIAMTKAPFVPDISRIKMLKPKRLKAARTVTGHVPVPVKRLSLRFGAQVRVRKAERSVEFFLSFIVFDQESLE